jgi:predicted kinase
MSCRDGAPVLIAVIGAPGSGKTTLAKALAAEMRLPCLHRDDFWVGLLDGRRRGARPAPTGDETTDAFLSSVSHLLSLGVSCIADDNFPARSAGLLESLALKASCVVVRASCATPTRRFADRLRNDPVASDPVILHAMGSDSVEEVIAAQALSAFLLVEAVAEFSTDLPILDVNTDDGFEPDIHQLVRALRASPL